MTTCYIEHGEFGLACVTLFLPRLNSLHVSGSFDSESKWPRGLHHRLLHSTTCGRNGSVNKRLGVKTIGAGHSKAQQPERSKSPEAYWL